jgi:hypothetical protein
MKQILRLKFNRNGAGLPLFLFLLSCSLPISSRAATTYDVGAGQPILTLASLPVLQPGDVVNIHCGVYHEVRIWSASGTAASPITLRGVCATGRPLVDGSGLDTSGNGGPRGDWEIQGKYYQIENMEFKNARNGDNGAGIRIMNANVTVTNCKITYCDMGIMTSTTNVDNVLVQNTEIAYNGAGSDQSHNVYLTSGNTVTFSYCYIHHSVSGENFKSRAHYTQLFYNFIGFGAESEVEGLDGAATVASNSNMTMIGNVLVSTPNRTVNTTKFVIFGQDVGGAHNGTLYLINNTMIAGASSIGFLRSSATNSAIVAVNNVFYGSNTIVQPGWTTNISGSNNWTPNTAVLPAGFTGTVTGLLPGFVDASVYNYLLTAASPVRDIGLASPVYFDGSGVSHSGIPAFSYVQPLSSMPRVNDGTLDAGAYEFSGTSTTVNSVPSGLSLTVDGTACTAPCIFQWTPNTTHTIAAANQPGASGVTYLFSSWSDSGAGSHTVTAAATGAAYTANFTTRYLLTSTASPSADGAISPATGWFDAGSVVTISAAASNGYQFSGFSGALTGTGSPQSHTMNGPASVTANFATISSPSQSGWYGVGGTWSSRKPLTINHTQVSGSSAITGFPVLISLTDANLKAAAKTDGSDILFTAADGLTKLNHQIEQYNSATGQLTAWVNVPSISPASDTTIFVYYGNPSASTQQNAAGVWDINFKGIWHFAPGTALNLSDSSLGGNNGVAVSSPTAASGKVGGAVHLSGSGQAVNVGHNSTLNVGNSFTVEAWVNPASLSSRFGLFTTRNINGAGSWQVEIGNDGNGNGGVALTGPSTYIGDTSSGLLAVGSWAHVVVSKNGAGDTAAIYVNGKPVSLVRHTTYSALDNTSNKFIGEGTTGGQFFNGTIDEVRLSNTVRTPAWIATEYNNQNAPGTFVTAGAQQLHP